jgi:hypothetical protein
MSDQDRRTSIRRAEEREAYARLQRQVDEVHARVFNGLGKDLRNEIKAEVEKVNAKAWALLVALLLIFAGIIVEGRVSSNTSSTENLRNYKAIVELESKIENHIIQTGTNP